MASYPYTLVPGADAPVYKPWVKVVLNYKKTHKITQGISALVDSGADVCFCSLDIGSWLGIQFKKKALHIFVAANSTKFSAYKESLSLHVCGKIYAAAFYFTAGLPRETPVILGQKGFFDHFRVTFDLNNKMMEIV